jgi:hypothetical protein
VYLTRRAVVELKNKKRGTPVVIETDIRPDRTGRKALNSLR